MQVIANNIASRNTKVAQALRKADASFIQELTRQCLANGADILDINLQHEFDRPKTMVFVAQAVQEVADVQLCLSSNSAETLEAGIRKCKRPPIVNYISLQEEKIQKFLPLAARHNADVILLPTGSAPATGGEDVLRSASVLVGAANEVGITNNRILIDPGVFHITTMEGQHHTQVLFDLIPALAETFEPQVRTTCWVENISAGIPARLRPRLNGAFLTMLSVLGLSTVFLDVLNKETERSLRLARILKGELIYSDRDAEL